MNNEDKYENMNKQEKAIYNFLHDCNIVFEDFNHLDGMLIPREMLIDQKKYESVKEHITKLKEVFSSSSLTSLQKDAKTKQKWPLLNLVRQILKSNDYKMVPLRKSGGYTKEGKKIYKRFFVIKKLKSVSENLNVELSFFLYLISIYSLSSCSLILKKNLFDFFIFEYKKLISCSLKFGKL